MSRSFGALVNLIKLLFEEKSYENLSVISTIDCDKSITFRSTPFLKNVNKYILETFDSHPKVNVHIHVHDRFILIPLTLIENINFFFKLNPLDFQSILTRSPWNFQKFSTYFFH